MLSERRFRLRRAALIACTLPLVAVQAPAADAAVKSPARQPTARSAPSEGGSSLEDAAAKAGNTGRAVAMSLIGLALAVAGIVLAFRRDFKEAAGVFAVGIVAVLLATPSGVSLLKDTVASLFGGR
jgi:hypothetical protein